MRKHLRPWEPHFPGDKPVPWGGGWLHTFPQPTGKQLEQAADAAAEAAERALRAPERAGADDGLFSPSAGRDDGTGSADAIAPRRFSGRANPECLPQREPYRDRDGQWCDGFTGAPLTGNQ